MTLDLDAVRRLAREDVGLVDVGALADALEAAQAEVERLADLTRLLGPAREVLDRCCLREAGANDEAGVMAQRIVDLIGHPVTDEPPHALVERERLRAQVAESVPRSALVQVGWQHTTGAVHRTGQACFMDTCGEPVYVIRTEGGPDA